MSETKVTKKEEEKALTIKQKMFLKEYFKTGNGTRAALKAYETTDVNVAATMASQNLIKLKDHVRSLMENKGLSLGKIIDVVNDATDATKVISSHSEPDYSVADHPTRLKAAEVASKWLGVEQSQNLTQVNIGDMKIKFVKGNGNKST